MPSFDVVSKVDSHELSNAVDQANREVDTRFDFKGVGAKFELTGKGADYVVDLAILGLTDGLLFGGVGDRDGQGVDAVPQLRQPDQSGVELVSAGAAEGQCVGLIEGAVDGVECLSQAESSTVRHPYTLPEHMFDSK